MRGIARPESVTALASDGVASARLGRACEDTITLAVRWRNRQGAIAEADGPRAKRQRGGGQAGGEAGGAAGRLSFTGSAGHATYTSSWVAAKGDVHSQQRWFYMGHGGEVTVDQAHR